MSRRPDGDIEEQLGMNRIITGHSVSGPRFGVRRKVGKAGGFIGAAVLCLATVAAPNVADAAHGGGGGFHGGGFGGFHGGGMGGFHGGFGGMHGGGFGGFHGGGFHEGGFHEGGFHGDRFHDGRFGRDRFRDNRFFFGGVFAYPYGWDYYPDNGYYDYSQPSASQTWYYCWDPAGYYPYVTQCNTGWQAVPAS